MNAFYWTVPKEWVIRETYIEDEDGTWNIDMKKHNLHAFVYSIAVDRGVKLDELLQYVYT